MSKPTPVLSAAGDFEELIERYAKHLGKHKIRRAVFNEVYGRFRKPRSIKQIMAAAGIADGDQQQVRNELRHLHKHELIVRFDNDGKVKDGSHHLYAKAEFVSANKDKIVRFADSPGAAKKIPTKRRPLVQDGSVVRSVTKQELRKKKHLTILYLIANPDKHNRLKVDSEVKKVQEKIRGSRFRDNITVELRPAADFQTLIDGLNDLNPQIVHFSGHGNEALIATEDESGGATISYELLAKALAATDTPPTVVFLNSCKSSAAKKALLPGTPVIVTMQTSVTDSVATFFATGFYGAIAGGQSIQKAFDQGKLAVEINSINDADIPELHHAPDARPDKLKLA